MLEPSPVSVVIPTLNEEPSLARLLPVLLSLDPVPHVIVSDGGSTDRTLAVAEDAGVEVVAGCRGRGVQLNAGGDRGNGEVLLFLHADSHLPAASYRGLLQTIGNQPWIDGGAFRFSLAHASAPWARIYEFSVGLRSRLLHLPYGDQGYFIRRRHWQAGHRFASLPLMEDVEWWQRLDRQLRLAIIPWPLITSARRFERRGYLRSALLNLWTLTRYKLGASPHTLAKEYYR